MKIVLKHADYNCYGLVSANKGLLECTKCGMTSRTGPISCVSGIQAPKVYTKRTRAYRGR